MPTLSLPRSLADLFTGFRGCFTAPTFRTFTALLVGLFAQPGQCTVTGMLVGAGVSGRWHHSRAYRFFAAARWSADQAGLVVLGLIVAWLLPAREPLLLVIDDSLFKRSGRKVFGAAWHYDATAPGRRRVAWGNNWVVLGVVAQVPCLPHRQMCLPVLARLWHPKQQPQRTKLVLARELVELVAAHLPNRTIHLVGDAAYAGSTLRELPGRVTITTRLRADAALYGPPPARTPGQRGRPRLKGDRLPELIVWAALVATSWQAATVACYGRCKQLELTSRICLWYAVWHTQPVRVVLARTPGASDGYDLALVSTDLDASPAELLERYATRWSIEQAFLDARHVLGTGQARNRTRHAVQRTVPFGLLAMSLLIIWYTRHGQPAADVAAHRARAPWYRTKQAPSLADMLVALRRELLAAQYLPSRLVGPTLEELLTAQVSWPLPADRPRKSRWYDRAGKGGQRRRNHGRQRVSAQLTDPALSVTGRSCSPTQPLAAGPCRLRTVTAASSRSQSLTPSHREVGHAADLHRPIRRHPLGHRPPATRRRQPLARDLSAQPQHPPPRPDLPGQVLTLPVDMAMQPPPRLYIVRRGDTLSGIAQRELGDASRWPEILERNREVLGNPDRVFPDQVLILPT